MAVDKSLIRLNKTTDYLQVKNEEQLEQQRKKHQIQIQFYKMETMLEHLNEIPMNDRHDLWLQFMLV